MLRSFGDANKVSPSQEAGMSETAKEAVHGSSSHVRCALEPQNGGCGDLFLESRYV
jgi:hypothetical protein